MAYQSVRERYSCYFQDTELCCQQVDYIKLGQIDHPSVEHSVVVINVLLGQLRAVIEEKTIIIESVITFY